VLLLLSSHGGLVEILHGLELHLTVTVHSLDPGSSSSSVDGNRFLVVLACEGVRLIFVLLLDERFESSLLDSALTGKSLLEKRRVGGSAGSRLALEVRGLNGGRLNAHSITELPVEGISFLLFSLGLIDQ
jgi:hypothetical protein